MTTEEKRKAIQNECKKYGKCSDCPHTDDEFCDNYNSDYAEPDVIDEWYATFFEGDKHYIEPSKESCVKDSGERHLFASGAVRDIQKGKGRCDLLPLDVVGHLMYDDNLIFQIYEFTNDGDPEHLITALEIASNGNGYPWFKSTDMFLEVSKQFEDGAEKYGEDNWQKGIPTHCYINSAVRHYLKWLRGDHDEYHDRAFVWNILCCIWTCKHKPELNDYGKEDKE